MTSLPGAVRKGSQLPRIESYPLFHTSAADDAIDLAEVAGLLLDPWQQHVLRASLGERRDGRWSAFRTCLVVPRQNGKNAVLEARELAGLLLFGEEVIIHTAHEFKTAHKSMIALMNRLRASELLGEVRGGEGIAAATDIRDIDGFKTGNQPSITMKNGNILQFAARSSGSGRGFTGDLVVLDEAYALKAAEMDALLPTMAAKSLEGNPQVWFTSSAGMPESDLLASLRKQGTEKSSDRLAYFEWSTSEDRDPLDRDGWYEANPGLGYRISEEFVQDEHDTLVSESGNDEGFKRERLGIWAKLGKDGFIPEQAWADCAGSPVEIELAARECGRIAFGVDIPPARDSATISVAADLGDGRFAVIVLDRREGVNWVPERLGELKETWNPIAVVLDELAGTGTLVQEIRRNKVRPLLIKTRELGIACARFFDSVTEKVPNAEGEEGRVLAHTNQAELNAAVRSAGKKTMGTDSVWKWARTGDDDIAPLISATLALHVLQSRKKKTTDKPAGSQRMIVMG